MPLFQEQLDGNAKKPHGDVNAQHWKLVSANAPCNFLGSLFSSSNCWGKTTENDHQPEMMRSGAGETHYKRSVSSR